MKSQNNNNNNNKKQTRTINVEYSNRNNRNKRRKKNNKNNNKWTYKNDKSELNVYNSCRLTPKEISRRKQPLKKNNKTN